MTPVRRADLPDTPDPGVCLRCGSCGATFSANWSDYFWAEPNKPLICEECPQKPNLELVRRIVDYVPIKRRKKRP